MQCPALSCSTSAPSSPAAKFCLECGQRVAAPEEAMVSPSPDGVHAETPHRADHSRSWLRCRAPRIRGHAIGPNQAPPATAPAFISPNATSAALSEANTYVTSAL